MLNKTRGSICATPTRAANQTSNLVKSPSATDEAQQRKNLVRKGKVKVRCLDQSQTHTNTGP